MKYCALQYRSFSNSLEFQKGLLCYGFLYPHAEGLGEKNGCGFSPLVGLRQGVESI